MSVWIKSQLFHAFELLSHSKLIFPVPQYNFENSKLNLPFIISWNSLFCVSQECCHLSEFQCFIKPKYMAPKRYPWLCRIVNDKFKINRRKKLFYTLIKVIVSSRNFFDVLRNSKLLEFDCVLGRRKFLQEKIKSFYRIWTQAGRF